MKDRVIDSHYRKNAAKLIKVVARRFNNDIHLASDAVQEAYYLATRYFKLWSAERASFDTWFNSILNNACRKIQNDERNKGIVKDPEDLETIPDDKCLEKDFHWSVLLSSIKKDIDNVPNEVHRSILIYYFNNEMPSCEIAELMGVSQGTVRNVIYRFKPFLQDRYAII